MGYFPQFLRSWVISLMRYFPSWVTVLDISMSIYDAFIYARQFQLIINPERGVHDIGNGIRMQ